MKKKDDKTIYFIGMIVAMLIWGVAWPSGKATAEHSNAEVAAFWRYAISFITIIPVIWYMKTPLKTDKIGALYMIIAGLLISLFNYLFFAGLSHGEAGYGGTMVTAISPILTYLLSITVFRTKVNTKQVIALSIGIFAAVILLKIPFEGLGFLNLNSSYFLECAVVWSVVTIIAQKASKRVDPMFYTLIVFGITGLTNMFFALPYHPFEISKFDSVFWWNILFIGVLAGTFSTALFFISASKIGAHQTGVFMFIVPVGAIVSSWFIYNENIVLSTVVGCVLAFVAVVLFNSKRGLRKKAQVI
ncbi:DMT family transporter [Halarcobacter anaerophilus]|uniref:EamA family transporter n=1 Tax=Halarcobacter anaerophilus TaxID=877500 RepID=A0A4Q0XV33_9BACT|nr:DMT family transporter [Halarcobacter anaerophilus]QDF28817.1 EamA/RhaT family transporter [Halarcobacter anaerophilus]RXJ61272.1 EamA family transporter [Halarcobacter anaerophilus]